MVKSTKTKIWTGHDISEIDIIRPESEKNIRFTRIESEKTP